MDPGHLRKAWKWDEAQMSIKQKGKEGNLKRLGKKNILDHPEQKVHLYDILAKLKRTPS